MADKWIEAAEQEIEFESRRLGLPVINGIAAIIQRHYDAWLAAQRPPPSAWSDEPPKEPGWYWWRQYRYNRTHWMAHVTERLGGIFEVSIAGDRGLLLADVNAGCLWQKVAEPKP